MWVAEWIRSVPRGVDCKRAGDVVGLFDVGEDLDRAVVIGLADLGDADLARGAVEQPRAEPVLQRLDVVAHHGRRHVELAGGGGETAGFNDPDESGQAGEAVHGEAPIIQPSLDNASIFFADYHKRRDSASCSHQQRPFGTGRLEIPEDAMSNATYTTETN